MNKDLQTKVIIYCRVSSERQKKEGHGLDSQEHRCREYALQKGYKVEKVFRDQFSGGGDFMKRPAMSDLLKYVDAHKHFVYTVIFDDLSRFARDVQAHLKLRQEFDTRNVTIECPNFTFEDTPEGKMVETILAAQNEYHRESNARQVVQKMRARLEAGLWPFSGNIPGYRSKKTPEYGKVLAVYNAEASLVKEALEGFASGRFQTQEDVKNFLIRSNFHVIRKIKTIYPEYVKQLLTRIIYTGYIEYPAWEVSRRKGKHEAIITLETYELIQERLFGKPKISLRKDIREDFPLRGSVLCVACEHLMTASWSKGRNGRYAYYRCNNLKPSKCILYGKGIRKSEIEDRHEKVLKSIRPKEKFVRLAEEIIKDVYKKKIAERSGKKNNLEKEIKQNEEQIEKLLERATATNKDSVAQSYEAKADELIKDNNKLKKSKILQTLSSEDFGTATDYVLGMLKNPYVYWQKGSLAQKKVISKIVFSGPLVYDREKGFGTAEYALPIKVFEAFNTSRSAGVEMGGVEPPCE